MILGIFAALSFNSQINSHGCFLKYFFDGGFPYFYSPANRGGEIYYRYSHNLSEELSPKLG